MPSQRLVSGAHPFRNPFISHSGGNLHQRTSSMGHLVGSNYHHHHHYSHSVVSMAANTPLVSFSVANSAAPAEDSLLLIDIPLLAKSCDTSANPPNSSILLDVITCRAGGSEVTISESAAADTVQSCQQALDGGSVSQSIYTSKSHCNLYADSVELESGTAGDVDDGAPRLSKKDIESLVLWKRPIKTIYHASLQLFDLFIQCAQWVVKHSNLCLAVSLLISAFLISTKIDGPHLPYVNALYKRLLWYAWWVLLGVLSSVGLGTGLHTFILYLGPHIASVTLAAYECNSLDFPEPPYPDQIICPTVESAAATAGAITVWSIMSKVRLEAFMWGAGTALGELPPYFISRAHRLAGDSQNDMLEEFEELEDLVPELEAESDGAELQQQQQDQASPGQSASRRRQSVATTVKGNMIHFMKRMGFFGILACASIPNPLFDLAGIICGYSLISFWTFFGATLIGKAVIKMHIQKLVVIIVFNEKYVQTVLDICKNIPYIGNSIHGPLRDYLQQQKQSLHQGANQPVGTKTGSWISFLFEWFVISMILYFLVSIINSMAQSHLKQRHHQSVEKNGGSVVKKSTVIGADSSKAKTATTTVDDGKSAKKD